MRTQPPAGSLANHEKRERRQPGGPTLLRVLLVWGAWMALCWAVVGWLLAPVLPGGGGTVAVFVVVTVAPVFALVRRVTGGGYPGAAFRLWVVRPFWYSQLVLPWLALAGLIGLLAGLPFGAAAVAGRTALGIAALAALAVGIAGYVGSRRLVVRRIEATFLELPHGLDGLRIVQISDTHVGPHTPRWFLARVAREVAAADPELIAVTGDLIDDFAPDVDHYAAALGGLDAPLGVFAVPGNHDVYAGWAEVRRRLDALQLTVLVNDHRVLRRGGADFAVVGTGDPAGRMWSRDGGADAAPNPDAALRGVPPGIFSLVLAHNPALWPRLAERGADLTLSGHTHWGQLAIPRLGWSMASPFLEHAMGVHRQGASLLYIHPGTNYWGIPFRLGTPPEIAVVTLRRGGAAGLRVLP